MQRLTVLLGFGLVLVMSSTAAAGPVIPAQPAITAAATALDDTILAKRKSKARPPGWGQGNKTGWRGHRMPPGQMKKHRY